MHILLVEDDKKVARIVQQGLEEENYSVDVAYDGEQGLNLALAGRYDVIVLDWLMPKMNGLEVVRELRARSIQAPVLLLTAKSSTGDKVEGLDSGADDYLTKPFAIAELLARIRSLHRRGASAKGTVLRVGDLQLDTVTHKAQRADTIITLTVKEYALLEFFMQNVNRVLIRSVISEHIWNYSFDTGTNIVEVYVNHLRGKIDDGFEKKLLHTVRGVGYVLKDE